MITWDRNSFERSMRGDFIWKEAQYETGVLNKIKHKELTAEMSIFFFERAVLQCIIKPNWLSHRVSSQTIIYFGRGLKICRGEQEETYNLQAISSGMILYRSCQRRAPSRNQYFFMLQHLVNVQECKTDQTLK